MLDRVHSRAYRWWADIELERVLRLIAHAQSEAGRPIRSVLHVGVGEGSRVDYWVRALPARHTGVDIDRDSVRALRLAARVQASGERLPFADQQFDLVIGIATFHHFRDPKTGMLECLRVGRALAFMEPLRSPGVRLLTRARIVSDYENGERIHRFDLRELRREWFDPARYRTFAETYLHKHVASIYPWLDRVNSTAVVAIMRVVYRLADWLLFPLHTKGVMVIDRRR